MTQWQAKLDEVRRALPSDLSLPEDRMRAVLAPLLDAALASPRSETIQEDCTRCPNCDSPSNSFKSPYCSDYCRQESAFVRQFRNAVETGTLLDPERQLGSGQAFWNLAGGGFPLRQKLMTAKQIAKVIERDGEVCAVCGAPATGVDHTGSG